MSSEMTTSLNFPVQNITHKPKRMQGDFIKNDEKSQSDGVNPDVDIEDISNIEGAIRYCENKAREYASLPNTSKIYSNISKWLRELLVTRNPKSIEESKSLSDSIEEVSIDAESNT